MKYLSSLNKYQVAVFLLFALVTTGCSVTPVHKSLDIALSKKIYNATALSIIPHEEISILTLPKEYLSGPGAGLLLVWVDKQINEERFSEAARIIAPLLKTTADVDFRTQYWNELEKELSSSSWLKIIRLDRRDFGYGDVEIANMKSPIIIFKTVYGLLPNAQVLVVNTKVSLYLKDIAAPDYFGNYQYLSEEIGKNNEEDEKAIELWSANNALAYHKSLAEGIEQNMKMLRLDLIDSSSNPINEKGEELELSIPSVKGSSLTIQGKILSRKASRVIIRDIGGNLFSVNITSP